MQLRTRRKAQLWQRVVWRSIFTGKENPTFPENICATFGHNLMKSKVG